MFRGLRRRPLGLAVGAFFLLMAGGVWAQARLGAPSDGFLLQADTLTFDRDRDLVQANGNVELTQGERSLRADVLTYNQRTDVIVASGNVVLHQPTGEVVFAEYVELTDDMREGFLRGLGMLLTDDSRLAAATGRRLGGTVTELDRATFSPCALCAKDPTRPPLWQVKATKVIHDQTTHDIVYHDAWIEFFGVPVFYTPYLSHPDPSVKSRTGFLAPTLQHSEDLGFATRIPFQWAIAPDRDLLVDPLLTTNAGYVLDGMYRQRFSNGDLSLRASAAFADGGDDNSKSGLRGHVDGSLRLNLDETWRAGGRLYLTSNDTYLERYKISGEDTLVSRAYAEGFWRRSYALAEAYHFQGLRAEDNQGQIPLVLPKLDFNYVSEPLWRSGRAFFDANTQLLTRTGGTDSGRLSVTGGWRQTFDGALDGDRLTLTGQLALDAYQVRDGEAPPQTEAEDGAFFRAFPQVSLEWSYPFVRAASQSSILVEPVAALVLAPNGGNDEGIPNEDSVNFNFDDTNIWSLNRFPGRDRVQGGSRFDYGMRAAWYGGDARVSGFLGQSIRFRDDNSFAADSGLEGLVSDLVGRVFVSPFKYLDASYRFRVDQESWTVHRHEAIVAAGPPAFQISLNYNFLARTGGEFDDREELAARASSKFAKYWTVSGGTRIELAAGDGVLSWDAAVQYQDECFDIVLGFTRDFTSDRDVPPTDTIMLRLNLKYLGEIANTAF